MTLRLAIQITAALFGLIGTLIAMRVSNEPYLWIFPCWSATFLFVALLSKAATAKAIWINIAVAAITLGAVEGYWSTHPHLDNNGRYAGSYTDEYFLKHEFLGHALFPRTEPSKTRDKVQWFTLIRSCGETVRGARN